MRAAGGWAVLLTLGPGDGWKLQAVELSLGHSVTLETGTAPSPSSPLPTATTDGKLVVWDRTVNSTSAVLVSEDLSTRTTHVLTLPRGTYPVRPNLTGTKVVFLDNSVAPHGGDPGLRGGHLMAYDLGTAETVRLDSADDANYLAVAGAGAAWYSSAKTGFMLSPVSGGGASFLGPGEPGNYLSDQFFLMQTPAGAGIGRLIRLSDRHTEDLPRGIDLTVPLALCGASIYAPLLTPSPALVEYRIT